MHRRRLPPDDRRTGSGGGNDAHISLDFKDLLRRYGGKLGHPNGVPAQTHVLAIQLVSSNRGSDATVEVKNVQAVLRNAQPAACQIRYRVPNQWANGYTAEVEITNRGAALTGWTLNWSLPGSQRLAEIWNASATTSGQAVSARNAVGMRRSPPMAR